MALTDLAGKTFYGAGKHGPIEIAFGGVVSGVASAFIVHTNQIAAIQSTRATEIDADTLSFSSVKGEFVGEVDYEKQTTSVTFTFPDGIILVLQERTG